MRERTSRGKAVCGGRSQHDPGEVPRSPRRELARLPSVLRALTGDLDVTDNAGAAAALEVTKSPLLAGSSSRVPDLDQAFALLAPR